MSCSCDSQHNFNHPLSHCCLSSGCVKSPCHLSDVSPKLCVSPLLHFCYLPCFISPPYLCCLLSPAHFSLCWLQVFPQLCPSFHVLIVSLKPYMFQSPWGGQYGVWSLMHVLMSREPSRSFSVEAHHCHFSLFLYVSRKEFSVGLVPKGISQGKPPSIEFCWEELSEATQRNLWNSGENRHTYWHIHSKSFAVTPHAFCLQTKFVNLLNIPPSEFLRN